MSYLILQSEPPQTIAVSKILCLAINYLPHAAEMQASRPEHPVVFLKPPSAIIHDGETILIPSISQEVHHEVELVVAISQTGKDIPKEQAMDYVLGYGVGLDMTLRDIQTNAKKRGQPWTIAKGFDTSAPISDFIPKEAIQDPDHLEIKLLLNGVLRQQGQTSQMIFKPDEIISYLSHFFTLNRGDLIFTGTPQGVGPVRERDVLKASLNDRMMVTVQVGRMN